MSGPDVTEMHEMPGVRPQERNLELAGEIVMMYPRGIAIILNQAAMFAVKAHAGQFRKDGTTPYCVHPLRVGALLLNFDASPIEVLCGYWHDILEDCPGMWDDMISEMEVKYGMSNATVQDIVEILEAVCKPTNCENRAARNVAFVRQVVEAGDSAILVKICDRIDNVMDSPGMGNFAEKYVVEETGHLVGEIGKLRPCPKWAHAFDTLCLARVAMIEKRGWDGKEGNTRAWK
jgi:(p)ppGpp synthase/HD superfamily hydrolase